MLDVWFLQKDEVLSATHRLRRCESVQSTTYRQIHMQQSHQAGYANAADRESGIPAAVLDGIKAVAKEKNATLMFRLVNPIPPA